MFITRDQKKEEFSGGPFGPEQFWERVELSCDDIWLYVITQYLRSGGKKHHYYLLTEPSDLVELIGQTGEYFWIECVMAILPPWINGTHYWEMHQLKELVAVADSKDLLVIDYLYRLANGVSYCTGNAVDDDAARPRQILFSEERHANTDAKDK